MEVFPQIKAASQPAHYVHQYKFLVPFNLDRAQPGCRQSMQGLARLAAVIRRLPLLRCFHFWP